MTRALFKSLPVKTPTAELDVDVENRIIRGVSCAQAVPALGHGLNLDEITIQQLAELGNARGKRGIKSRDGHPGLSASSPTNFLGRMKNFRVEGDKVKSDLHVSEIAEKGDWVLGAAQKEADQMGFSVVIDQDPFWKLEDGSEIAATEIDEDGDRRPVSRPDGSVSDFPFARVSEFAACDLVDEPAANRDGMASTWGTNQLSEQMFGEMDSLLAEHGIEPAKAFEFALKYFNQRNVDLKEFAMADKTKEEKAQVEQPDLTALQDEMATMRAALAEALEGQQEASQTADQYREALDTSNERVAALENAARNKRFADLSTDWFGDVDHIKMLASLADTLGEDSDEFTAYVKQQNAVAEQVMSSELLQEFGTSRTGEDRSAASQLESKAQELMATDNSLTHAQAYTKAAEQNPDLYRQHTQEMRG